MIPKLHVVTDDEILARPDFEARAREVFEMLEARERAIEEAGEASVFFHIRGARTPGRELTRLARFVCECISGSRVVLVVNDRLDVALAVGAGGVHLATHSLPLTEAGRLMGARRFLGVSVHSVGRAVEAAESGADYLFVGTLFETPSHPESVAAGPEFMDLVASRVDVPLIGIGGVTPERALRVLASGGHGVAAIRGIWDAPSPPDAVQAYLDAVGTHTPGGESDA